MKHSILILLLVALTWSCKKDEDDTADLAKEPSISFVDLSPTEVDNFNNTITLTIKYKDNNGDLGFDDPDQFALSVKDSRLDSADWYHIPPLSPVGKNIIIEGELEIVLNSMFILGNGNQELVSLCVKMRDRANNWSNVIFTPPITIKK